jgi:hypothetical protein
VTDLDLLATLPPLCSVADVEAITGSPVAEDDHERVERLIAMASAAVRRFCHQDFLPPVPDDLVGLVAAKVAGFLSGGSANPDGLKSLQVGAMSESYANTAGTDLAMGPGVLTEIERDTLRALGYRQQTTTLTVRAYDVPAPVLIPRFF